MSQLKHVNIFTDGACSGNPGPGGYGAILVYQGNRKYLSDGFARTTNNRMEMLAAIAALEALKSPCRVTLYSDSKYLVDSVQKGWARGWEKKNWKKSDGKKAANIDLWKRLFRMLEKHEVEFSWVEGHAGHPENEKCDEMAVAASQQDGLKADEGYEDH